MPTEPPDTRPTRRDLILLFVLALLPRLAGLLWGNTNSDENFGRGAKILAGEILIEPSYYPPLKDYLNAIAYAAMFAAGRFLGVWNSLAAFREQYFSDPSPFIFAARLTTVLVGAAIAPAAALAASRAGVGRRAAWLVGLALALFPLHVFVCHVNRTYDVGLCSALLLTLWAIGRKLDDPTSPSADYALGLITALAASFKQSAIFALIPMYLGLGVGLLRTAPPASWLPSLVRIVAVMTPAWILLNLPSLVHLHQYLEFQRTLQAMWVNPATLTGFRREVVPNLLNTFVGGTAPAVVLGLLTPVWARNRLIAIAWIAGVGSLIAAFLVSGAYQDRLYMPSTTLLIFTAAAGAGVLLRQSWRPAQAAGGIALAAILGTCAWGSLEVVRQALLEPMSSRVNRAIAAVAEPESTRILIGNPNQTTLPLSQTVVQETRRRHERLAAKYGVDLGPWAPERSRNRGPGYLFTGFPWAIGGFEHHTDADLKGKIQPFGWPIQPEEWDLDYWTSRGYTVFVVFDGAALSTCGVPAYERLYAQIREHCELVDVLASNRPLFFETEVRVYRLRDAADRPAGSATDRDRPPPTG
jgi:hypothetical protein